LVSKCIEVRWLNRGGGCIVHAPGQLAAYPILPIDRLQIGLAEHRRRLEQSAINVCRELRIPAYRDNNKPGAWCRTGRFAEIGVAVRSWVTYHGLCVNVSTPAQLHELIDSSSGGELDEMTTLTAERHTAVSMHVVREGLVRQLAHQLGYDEFHLYTGHPLLTRTRRRVHVHA
jgi:lipoyl(octanoyl) transferase